MRSMPSLLIYVYNKGSNIAIINYWCPGNFILSPICPKYMVRSREFRWLGLG